MASKGFVSSAVGLGRPGGMVRPIDQASWHGIKAARQRMVLCRLMIDIMRGLHGAYAPASEPFGTRLETFFIALCVALGELEERDRKSVV